MIEDPGRCCTHRVLILQPCAANCIIGDTDNGDTDKSPMAAAGRSLAARLEILGDARHAADCRAVIPRDRPRAAGGRQMPIDRSRRTHGRPE